MVHSILIISFRHEPKQLNDRFPGLFDALSRHAVIIHLSTAQSVFDYLTLNSPDTILIVDTRFGASLESDALAHAIQLFINNGGNAVFGMYLDYRGHTNIDDWVRGCFGKLWPVKPGMTIRGPGRIDNVFDVTNRNFMAALELKGCDQILRNFKEHGYLPDSRPFIPLAVKAASLTHNTRRPDFLWTPTVLDTKRIDYAAPQYDSKNTQALLAMLCGVEEGWMSRLRLRVKIGHKGMGQQ